MNTFSALDKGCTFGNKSQKGAPKKTAVFLGFLGGSLSRAQHLFS